MAPKAREPRWVSRLVADAVHFDLLATHGGMPGFRDEDALESALARPRQRHSYEAGSDIGTLAAAYGFGIARNHPFNDGNKRVAFIVMAVFAGLNGFDVEAPEAEVVTFMLDLAAGSLTEEQLAEWLRSRLVASPDGTSG
ncbi:MAG: type II toxin-antitoxin system death-on-curing family toxin [Actinomycetota bacterium]|nr:type II toxin-antitoxin system death-on-curing family toxin [Actinomycetota bacterium]